MPVAQWALENALPLIMQATSIMTIGARHRLQMPSRSVLFWNAWIQIRRLQFHALAELVAAATHLTEDWVARHPDILAIRIMIFGANTRLMKKGHTAINAPLT